MRRLKIFLALLSLPALSFASSSVIETIEYSEIFQKVSILGEDYGNQNVLVVFDIDDTLLVIDHCEKEDGTLTQGIGKLFACPSTHTEDIVSHEIKSLQGSGFATMALTARGVSLIKPTKRELARKHQGLETLSFAGKPFHKFIKNLAVPKTRKCKQGEQAPCLTGKVSKKPRFEEGVLYANGTHKGLALKAFLALNEASFKAIVFVDDRKKNTDDVHELFKNQEVIEVTSYLYLRHRD